MRFTQLAIVVLASLILIPQPGYSQGKKKVDKKTAKFEPVEISGALDANDPNDPRLNQPSKKYTVKLTKDKTYVIDMISKDFDSYLRLLDKSGEEVADDDDSGGDLNARIIYSPKVTSDHQIVAITLDGTPGKFKLKVREVTIKGEAKARDVAGGIKIDGKIAKGDESPLGRLGKVYSVNLKAGRTYALEMASEAKENGNFLYLFDSKSKMLVDDDDDAGGNQDTHILFNAEANGVYHIIATADEPGEFTLKVHEVVIKGEAKARDVGNGININGKIASEDQAPVGKLGKIYSVNLKAGQTYTINMASQTIDSFLYVFDSKSKKLAADDDSGGNQDARIVFRADADGVYHIVATSFEGQETGDFTLSVRQNE